jgi:hypothetical protein
MILCQNTTHTKEMPMEWQTLYYKPHFETKVKKQKVKNLYFGQLTVPGPERSTCINFWKIGVGIN